MNKEEQAKQLFKFILGAMLDDKYKDLTEKEVLRVAEAAIEGFNNLMS